MFLIKNFKNAKFKKKLSYKFTNFFKIINVIDTQTYRFRLLKKIKNLFCFLYFFFKIVLRKRQRNEIKKYNICKKK